MKGMFSDIVAQMLITLSAPIRPSADCLESFIEVFLAFSDCLTSMSLDTYKLSDFRIDFNGMPQLPIKLG